MQGKVRGASLKERCKDALTYSETLATEAWRIVAQAKLKKAQKEGRDRPRSKSGSARALLELAGLLDSGRDCEGEVLWKIARRNSRGR